MLIVDAHKCLYMYVILMLRKKQIEKVSICFHFISWCKFFNNIHCDRDYLYALLVLINHGIIQQKQMYLYVFFVCMLKSTMLTDTITPYTRIREKRCILRLTNTDYLSIPVIKANRQIRNFQRNAYEKQNFPFYICYHVYYLPDSDYYIHFLVFTIRSFVEQTLLSLFVTFFSCDILWFFYGHSLSLVVLMLNFLQEENLYTFCIYIFLFVQNPLKFSTESASLIQYKLYINLSSHHYYIVSHVVIAGR